MTTFRFFLDFDAENLDDAKEQLIEMAGDGASFGDLDNMEIEDKSQKLTLEELLKFLGVKTSDEALKLLDGNHFTGWDGWWCLHCGHVVGCDWGDMLDHLKHHTIEELKLDHDGEPMEDNS